MEGLHSLFEQLNKGKNKTKDRYLNENYDLVRKYKDN